MDSVQIRTTQDFENPLLTSHKRRKYSTLACDCCRRLKRRCLGGEPAFGSLDSPIKPCSLCISSGRDCVWPKEDGRRRQSGSMLNTADPLPSQRYAATDTSSSTSVSAEIQVGWNQEQHKNAWPCDGVSPPGDLSGIHDDGSDTVVLDDQETMDQRSRTSGIESPKEGPADATLHYYRHLGPTAIAPGHKKIKVKVRQHAPAAVREAPSSREMSSAGCSLIETSPHSSCVPLFDSTSGLPSSKLLPHLLETFFEYYGDHFGFISLPYLNRLIESGKVSIFLICSMSALSARFCQPEMFSQYFEPLASGEKRERWEFSLPFLERAKILLMPLLSIPSPDVVAGLLLLSWVEFGDNNEAGMVSVVLSSLSLRRTEVELIIC